MTKSNDKVWLWLCFKDLEQCRWFVNYRPKNFNIPIHFQTGHPVEENAKEYKRLLTTNLSDEDLQEFILKARNAWRKYRCINKLRKSKFAIKQYALPNSTIKELESLARNLGESEVETIIKLIGGSFDIEAQRNHEEKIEKHRFKMLRQMEKDNLRFETFLSKNSIPEKTKKMINELKFDQLNKSLEIKELKEEISKLQKLLDKQKSEISTYERKLKSRVKRYPIRD